MSGVSDSQTSNMSTEECNSAVYVWGSASNGALGCQPKPTKVQLVPRQLSQCCADVLKKSGIVTGISAGNGVTTIVTNQNKAYSWGESILKHCAAKGKKGNCRQVIERKSR